MAPPSISWQPSRWCRTDNVFGYDFTGLPHVINGIWLIRGLPPFSAGESFYRQKSGEDSKVVDRLPHSPHRLDAELRHRLPRSRPCLPPALVFGCQKLSQLKTGHYGDYDTGLWPGLQAQVLQGLRQPPPSCSSTANKTRREHFQKAARLESIEKIAEYARG